ncbi:permease prefix domain 1-containing protein [Brachybacterium sp. AOP43-C2-M15]|uniref:permease prefix domain 1-containing protein n=1 Tax=Brachybacterium sp. AOP43-C2-M15 TaxID=3457661 RepID=UPI004034C1A7
MNVIDSYLDTLFAPYPDTARLREARTELRAMMEDTQQGLIADGLTESQAVGRVIAEFGTLEEVAPVLGIDTELSRSPEAADAALPELDVFRAREYVEAVRRTQWMPATGLALFVLCAVPLLLLIAATTDPSGSPAGWAVAAGITAVLVLVASGILLLLGRDLRLKDFEDIDEGDFTPGPQVRAFAEDLERERRSAVTIASAVAILLWILCALPVILVSLLSAEMSFAPLYGVSLTLAMVAAGLAIMTGAGWSDTATGNLLQEPEDEDDPERSDNPVVRAVAAIYWPVAAAIYLAWSFLSGDWGVTWVLWPVAGVLYAGLSSLSAALRGDDVDRRRRPRGRRH